VCVSVVYVVMSKNNLRALWKIDLNVKYTD